MPATLPCPKIENTPAKRRSSPPASSMRSAARWRTSACAIVSRIVRVMSWPPRLAPRVDERREVRAHAGLQRRVVDRAREPACRRFLEHRAADRETAAARTRARLAKPLRERLGGGVETEQHHAPAVRIALGDQRVDRAPLRFLHRLELPPLGKD